MSTWGAKKEETSSGWNKSSTNESSGAARSRSRSPPRRVRSPSPRGGAGASSGSGGAVKLYVGNLSFNTNKDSLFDTFGKFGTVVDAFVAMDRDAGRSKGFGFVTFEDPQAASAAKDGTNGQEIDGRTIRVDFAGEKPAGGDRTAPRGGAGGSGGYGGASGGQQRRGNPACTLVISNLPYTVSWQTLKDHFRSAGNVRRADVNSGSDGRSSGSGIVEFSSPDEAQNAIRTLHDSSLNDRRISVALEGGGGGDSRSGGYEDRGRSSYSSSYDDRRGGDSYDDRRSAPSSYDRPRGYDDHDRRGSYSDDRRGSYSDDRRGAGGGYDRDGGRGDSRRSDNRDYERRRD